MTGDGFAMGADGNLNLPARCLAELNRPGWHRACGMFAGFCRCGAVVSLFTAIMWMDRGDIALFAIVFLALLLPQVTFLPRPFDAAVCGTLLLATWSAVLDLYQSVYWLDDVVHFSTNGAAAAALYLVLARVSLIRGTSGTDFERNLATPVVLTTLIGLALGVIWEFVERLDTILNPGTVYGYTDTIGDLAAGGLGSVLAGISLLHLLATERKAALAGSHIAASAELEAVASGARQDTPAEEKSRPPGNGGAWSGGRIGLYNGQSRFYLT
jgi:hypothetical protein